MASAYYTSVLSWGIPTAVCLAGGGVALAKLLSWRFDRVPLWLSQQTWGFLGDDKMFDQRWLPATVTMLLLLLSGPLLMMIWAIVAAANALPDLARIIFVVSAMMVGAYAIKLWHEQSWRFSTSVKATLALSLGLWFLFQLVVTLVPIAGASFSFLAFSSLFLTFNMLPVVAIVFLNAPGRMVDITKFIHAPLPDDMTADGDSGSGDSGSGLQGNTPSTVALPMVSSSPTYGDWTPERRRRVSIALYGVSLTVLLVYSILVLLYEPTFKGLGFASSGAVIVLDSTLALYHHAGLLTRPLALSLALTLCRTMLVFSARYYFVCHSFVFLCFAIVLGIQAVSRRLPAKARASASDVTSRVAAAGTEGDVEAGVTPDDAAAASTTTAAATTTTTETQDAGDDGADTPTAAGNDGGDATQAAGGDNGSSAGASTGSRARVAPSGVAGSNAPASKAKTTPKEKLHAFIRSHEGILLYLVILFVVDVIIAALLSSTLSKVQFTATGKPHGQWEFGIAAIVLTLLVPMVYASYRVYAREAFEVTKPVLVTTAATTACIIAAGLIMFWLTDSHIILMAALFLPLYAISGYAAYRRWVKHDYELLGPAKLRQPPNASLWTAVKNKGLPRQDCIALGNVIGSLLWLLLMAILLNITLPASYAASFAWSVFSVIFIITVTTLAVKYWLNTLSRDKTLYTLAAISFVSLFTFAALYAALVLSSAPAIQQVYLWGAVLLYLLLVTLIVGVYHWRDQQWQVDKFTAASLGVSLFLILAFIIVVCVLIKPLAVGLAMLTLYLMAIMAIALVVVWVRNRYYLPKRYRGAVLVLVALSILLGIVAGVGYGAVFVGFSFAWANVIIALATVSWQRYISNRHVQYIPGRYLFPVYRFDPSTQSVASWNSTLAAPFALLAAVAFWGASASIFMAPQYIGVCIMSLCVVLSAVTAVSLVVAPMREFGRAARVVTPDMIDAARKAATQAQLGSGKPAVLQLHTEQPLASTPDDNDGNDSNNNNNNDDDDDQRDAAAAGTGAGATDNPAATTTTTTTGAGEPGTPAGDASQVDVDVERQGSAAHLIDEVNKMRLSAWKRKPINEAGKPIPMREAMALIHDYELRIQCAFMDELRFAAHFASLVVFSARAKADKEERLLNAFLRDIGRSDVTLDDILGWDEATRAEFERERQEYLEKRRANDKDQARKAAEEEEATRRRAAQAAEIAATRERELEEREKARRQELDGLSEADRAAKEAELQAEMEKERRRLHGELTIEEIAADCEKAGKLFEDPEFPADDNSLYIDVNKPKDFGIAGWKRAKELCEGKPVDPDVFHDGADASDIAQGALGDCWFLSALSVLTLQQKRLLKLFVNQKYSEWGVYQVQFYKNGKWRKVTVDDRFPINQYGLAAFGRSAKDGELWVMILEKAYAKLHGSFEAIEGGQVHLGLVDMTGGASEDIALDSDEVKTAIADGSLWTKMLAYYKAGYLMGCGSHAGSDTDVTDMGIVLGHAYSILDVQEVDGHQLLCVRNPWGRGEWKGDWSDTSPLWTKRMCALLNFVAADDGLFWISFADFCLQFRSVYICRIFNDSWLAKSLPGEWKGDTAGGCPNFDSCTRNPMYHLQVARPTRVFIVLAQTEKRGSSSEDLHIGFLLARKGGKRLRHLYQGELVTGSGPFLNRREVSAELELQPEAQPYTLFCSTFQPGQESSFTVTVHSDSPLAMFEAIPADAPVA